MMNVSQIIKATGGLLRGPTDGQVDNVCTDSRVLTKGDLFVALKGPNFDGHTFVSKAFDLGAKAAIVSDESSIPASEHPPVIVVPDTLRALQDLSLWYRNQFPELVVGALTGSAGKTTTKELIASILDLWAPTLVTRGNLNNHIGVPLTLFRIGPEHRFAVIEMGCSGFSEIELLASLARPSFGLITNVGGAHLEGLGDLEGVKKAKGELFASLPKDGTAIVNLDDIRVRTIKTTADKMLTYGTDEQSQVRLVGRTTDRDGRQKLTIRFDDDRRIHPKIGLFGEHNGLNATAAAAFASALGVELDIIERGLSRFKPTPGRLAEREGKDGLRILDDSYNANPESVKAALMVLKEQSQAIGTHALLGEMLELGPDSAYQHEEIGRFAARMGLQTLIGVGNHSSDLRNGAIAEGMNTNNVFVVETPEEAAELVRERADAGHLVLVKGSRGAHMERAFPILCPPCPPNPQNSPENRST